MLSNYITTAFRNFLKSKGYTFISISGLSVGLASCILILLWVRDEAGMNKFHKNGERIYKVWRNMYQASGQINTTPGIPQPLELVLENEYSEVDQVALIGWEIENLFQKDDKIFREKGRYVSPEFLQMFSFPFLAGDLNTALDDIHSVVISESLAIKYFGINWKEAGALGKTLRIDNREEFKVTGIFEDPGSNSSLHFDWLLPAQDYISRNEWVESWYNGGFRMYVSLKEGINAEEFATRVEQEINIHTNYEANEPIMLQKFTETYLHSKIENGVVAGGRIDYVRILFIVAIFILVIACINFMNLATARSTRRAMEIGLRKAMGARRESLSLQFLTESLLISVVSVLLAVLFVYLVLPYFNNLTGKSMVLDFSDPQVLMLLGSITIISGFLSGSYPALLLPSFNIISSLKGTIRHSRGSNLFRKGLVIFQFAISILLLIGTLVVYRQLEYILNKNLGLDRENLVTIELEGEAAGNFESYKTELLRIPEVMDVTSISGNPLSYGSSTGGASWEGKNPDDVVEINVMNVSLDFVKTMGMELSQGRGFSEDYGLDSANVLVNEVAAAIMGYENPIGSNLSVWGTDGQIIGVIKNFHMDSMYEPIAPLIVRFDPPQGNFMTFIRIQGNTQDALLAIEKVTRSIDPRSPFNYGFLDAEYEDSYRSEITLSTLTNYFAGIALLISCLGLFGLSSFSAELRSREIGIRKVHGAGVMQLILMLSRDYTKLIVFAFIISAPLAYYYMENWLTRFEFRTSLDAGVFVFSGIAAFVVAVLTISFKSFQAASANPVKTLKEE